MENRVNRTDLPKIIALWEEHRGESWLNNSADLGRKLMNGKDQFMFNLVFDLYSSGIFYVPSSFRWSCLLFTLEQTTNGS